ncbi:hypothetical protein B0H14DRAFT_3429331 [Mycena olivaceomarginata]|nr:hypothetical protein B0H14DRAFT_3429331 [Mycena olivaceomarginata]
MVDGAVLTLDGAPFLMADVGRRANEGRNRDGARTIDGAVLTVDGAPLLMEMSAVMRDLQITEICVGLTRSPLWSYQFGLQTGFMPIDPRDSVGVVKDPLDGVFSAWQTGSVGAGTLTSVAVQSNGQQPPATLPNAEASAMPLPTHIPTASIAPS